MASSRDNFAAGVRDILAHRAGFRCSKPDCRAPTAGPSGIGDQRSSIGIAAHITAAASGGPRYDPTMSAEQRSSVANGIWLCDNHARQIDGNAARFTTEVLKAWKVHAEDDARAMLGRPLSATGLEVAIELSLLRDTNEGLLIVGETNLPDGARLMGSLRWAGARPYYAQARCSVSSRRLLLGPFTDGERALPQRWYEAEVYSYFNGAWQQPAHVLEVTGVNGSKLLGNFASPLDPDLDETDYSVRARVECPAPPLNSEEPLTDEEIVRALDLLKNSVLNVQGHDQPRSSEPVIEVVQHYMRAAGLGEKDGWRADVRLPGIVEVIYSFWDGATAREARWQVMARSKEVRYRNSHAKMLSWLPDY